MERTYFQQHFSPLLPDAPGIYKYYGKDKKILYVGKAKNLKKRVTSYFNKNQENNKTVHLVNLIHQIEWTITDNEHDAFLLENSLIKHFKPPFNISLKDDKTYPFVVIKNEHFPRLFLTRQIIKDGSEYIGPFTSVHVVRELLQLIRESIPLRTCGLNLSPRKIAHGKYKVCLEYHLGNCKGPCEGIQSAEEYKQSIHEAKQLLKGNLSGILQKLKEERNQYTEQLAFEKAHLIQQRIDALQVYDSKSSVINTTINHADVITIQKEKEGYFVNYLSVSSGKVLHSKSLHIEQQLDETPEDVLSYALSYLQSKFQSEATEIITAIEVIPEKKHIKVTIPKLGERKRLLDLSFKNLHYFIEEFKHKGRLQLNQKTASDRLQILENLQEQLQLPDLPTHIECFDNSNFQGTNAVAAMVCFRNGFPSKQDYRKFHIKTVEGIDDFASMEEIVYRRYKRLMEENAPLPNLVIIDGGKGQLGAAMKSITELGLIGRMTVVGLAKREESLFFPGDKEPLQLPFNSPELLLIRSIRDEVHRFGITFHRQKRASNFLKNPLLDIPGIGPKTAESLLQHFRSVTKLKKHTEEEIAQLIGAAKAKIVVEYLHNHSDKKASEK